MTEINEHLDKTRAALRRGSFTSEAAVSQGIVLPTLAALGWPVFDTSIVIPEFSLEGRRVDYALCHPADRPAVFIEVKRVGLANGADRQLFEYAFHIGVPLAILTDGQEWNFYLPGEQGHYSERRVYKLDLLERDKSQSAERLERYLNYSSTCGGSAIRAARADYRDVARKRETESILPRAWRTLVRDQDSSLLELLAEKVEDICGYKPELDACADFLSNSIDGQKQDKEVTKSSRPVSPTLTAENSIPPTRRYRKTHGYSFQVLGRDLTAGSAREVMTKVFQALAHDDKQFLNRFAARKHGKKRRYLSQNRAELYPNRPDLVEAAAVELTPGWWMGTNYSRRDIQKILELAKEVARPEASSTIVAEIDQ